MSVGVGVVILIIWWVGHACIWTAALNDLYGRPLPKQFLKLWRLFTGVVIVAGVPALIYGTYRIVQAHGGEMPGFSVWHITIGPYLLCCLFVGGIVFPIITIRRLLRDQPSAVLSESTRTLDLWPELGAKLLGTGKYRWVPRLPFNCVYRVDFTDLTLAPPRLPPAWDGLSILVLSDLHFYDTPSRAYFDRVIDELAKQPTPDIVALVGDYVDIDTHHEWVRPVLGRLTWVEAGFAVLGNHDAHHQPDRVRGELAACGYRVLSNRWEEATIRGVRCVVSGHEGPWLGRRYDQGVFQDGRTVMAVGRGVSGKEPLRFRCHPQVLRITLRSAPANGGRVG